MKIARLLVFLLPLVGCSMQRQPLSCALTNIEPRFGSGMRNQRYCEILFMHGAGERATGCVYTTWGLNECPEAQWQAIDPRQLAREYQIDQAIMNGPRYWVMDTFTIDTTAPGTSIGGLEMKPGASIDMPRGAILASHLQQPYTETAVVRNTTFTYDAGQPIFLLVSPEHTYIMQSYSQIVDPTLTYEELPTLGPMLNLPDGWSYDAKTPTTAVKLVSGGTAYVIQDSLQNTYQRMPDP